MKGSVLTGKTWLLLIVAALLIAAGALNFSQRLSHQPPPWDGVTWVDTSQGVIAKTVEPGSAAFRSQVTPGDHLIAISMVEPIPNWTARDLYINLIGLVYLFVGLFVIFKQGGRSPFVLHFASLCLTAFVFHFYTPIGTYKDLDLAIAFLRSAGLIMFAPLFLHFSAIYPVRYHLFEGRRWRSVLLYVPTVLLLSVATFVFFHDELSRVFPQRLLDYSPNFAAGFYKAAFIQFAIALVASAALLVRRFVISKNTVARQQLKWVVWGSALAIAPFTVLYALGFILTESANPLTDAAVAPLILIPLAMGYSVVRYRLMDVGLFGSPLSLDGRRTCRPPGRGLCLHYSRNRRCDRGDRLLRRGLREW